MHWENKKRTAKCAALIAHQSMRSSHLRTNAHTHTYTTFVAHCKLTASHCLPKPERNRRIINIYPESQCSHYNFEFYMLFYTQSRERERKTNAFSMSMSRVHNALSIHVYGRTSNDFHIYFLICPLVEISN